MLILIVTGVATKNSSIDQFLCTIAPESHLEIMIAFNMQAIHYIYVTQEFEPAIRTELQVLLNASI
jgi:hypothetical protein